MKLSFHLFSALTLYGAAHGASTGVRGGQIQQEETTSNEENRELQTFITRTPIVRNVEREDNGGFARTDWPFGGFQNRPAISAFSFDYVGGDVNVDTVEVNAGLTRTNTEFSDFNDDDNYFLSVTAVELPPSTLYDTFTASGLTGCRTSPPQEEVQGRVPILQSFKLDYDPDNFDRNIQKIGVEVDTLTGSNAPIITSCHADFNDDDAYSVRAQYALVEERFVLDFDIFTNTVNGGGLDNTITFNPPPNSVAVITGFNLEFLSGDLDLAKLQVELNQNGRIYVHFGDDSDNDAYEWTVKVAFITAEA